MTWQQLSSSGVSHTHSNKTTLDKLGEANNELTFEGNPINSGGGIDTTTIDYFNLFNSANVVNGQYHSTSNGSVVAGGQETHAIEVKPGYTYNFNRGDTLSSQYAFFDASNNFLSGSTALSAKAPANAKYLYVRIWTSQMIPTFMVTESYRFNSLSDYVPHTKEVISNTLGLIKSNWHNKRWWILGDSISTGIGEGEGASNAYASKPYHYLLARERFIKVQNSAASGYTIGQIYDNIIVNMPPTEHAPDLITIMAGTNDHGFNIGMGTIDSATSEGNFYGRYKKAIEFLQSRYPLTPIGLITPIRRKTSTLDGETNNAAGFTLRQYCEAVKAIGKYYSLPVLDLYDDLGFTPYNATQNTNFFISSDGTHPNNEGHKRIATKVGDFIEKI